MAILLHIPMDLVQWLEELLVKRKSGKTIKEKTSWLNIAFEKFSGFVLEIEQTDGVFVKILKSNWDQLTEKQFPAIDFPFLKDEHKYGCPIRWIINRRSLKKRKKGSRGSQFLTKWMSLWAFRTNFYHNQSDTSDLVRTIVSGKCFFLGYRASWLCRDGRRRHGVER